MESSIVVKVKYGETLRRFNARVVGQKLGLNMEELREKILHLLNLSPDSEVTLTYIDEDGDVVTLADDEDLKDVVKQELDPLRIYVKLDAGASSRPSAKSSGTSTPLRSSFSQPKFQNLNDGVSVLFKTVPEPLREALIKMSADMSSKATSSAPPVLSELVEAFSKMGVSYLNQLQGTQSKKESDSQEQAQDEVLKPSEASLKTSEPTLTKAPEVEAFNTKAASVNLNEPLIGSAAGDPEPAAVKVDVGNRAGGKKFGDCSLVGKALGISCHSTPSVTRSKDNKTRGSGSSSRKISRDGFGSGSHPGLSFVEGCPFTGLPTADNPYSPLPVPPSDFSLKGSHPHNVGSGTIFHKGVRCDGCGVHPITGPRFKSKVKEDYDLCVICFTETGSSEADYIRIDRPVSYRHPWSFRGLSDHHRGRMGPTAPHHLFQGVGVKPTRPKLDSRFIQDVNILDGTIVAPLTRFTKIWRMRNNGNVVWPQSTQLVWIGGDRLSDAVSVELEVPAAGLPVEQELDVAVDFVAPELPGRYVSYWRMALPSGQKFGQRVWVLIQVATSTDERMKKPVPENLRGLNLNLPPSSSNILIPEMVYGNPLMLENHPEPNVPSEPIELVEPAVEGTDSMKEHEMNFPVNDSLFAGLNSEPQPTAPATSSSISYPVVDLSNVAAPPVVPAGPSQTSTTIVDKSAAQGEDEKREMELTLLKELEEMGFKQIDLNKEILRMNEYDLEQSVDDLCGVSDWDPILEELEEMGFCDKEVNKKLLKKNGGSIKRVVMDLIAGEK